jgi:PAS domain S-box-containing protein
VSSGADNLDLFRLVAAQAPDGVIFADCEGVVQVWNNAAADLFGYLPENAIGRTLDIIIPEHLRRAHWEGFGKAVASGHTTHGGRAIKTWATHKDGHKPYVSVAFSAVKDREGRVIGVTARAFVDGQRPGRVAMERRVTGFHRDEEEHWVAELECGHNQHVRHDPPWEQRPWVVTEEGRRSRLGMRLNCVKCDRGEPRDRPG